MSHGVSALQGEVWAVGGRSEGDGYLAAVEVHSPQLNTWRAGVALPRACMDCKCVAAQC